ncbi:MAG: hypothetical protein B7O98_01815 [Zestosphaera tikiterensis]|uniref:Polymerase/histidinol phosphatase N-terminal domain-containing protein n=1 Tax=Zestosphaera tikiterensis TaxID=1973259 RepID=A0A2R7Y6T3_9CREN|nr:MAG: hypothetical protein B7O98_01815 [Zestosphaera tikiterensis]
MLARADLHIHSYVSDGEASPKDIVKYARKLKLNVISITDHNSFLGSVIASRYAEEHDIVVLLGNEVRTVWGDVLIFCEEPITVSENPYLLRDIAKENSCVIIPAHPFDLKRLGVGGKSRIYDLWDGFEVFNARSDPITNLLSYLMLRNKSKTLLSNSDAHTLSEIGCSYNLIYVNDLKKEEVLDALKKGRTLMRPAYKFNALHKMFSWSFKARLYGISEKQLAFKTNLLPVLRGGDSSSGSSSA